MHAITLAEAEDSIEIIQGGKLVARLIKAAGPRKRVDVTMLQALTVALPAPAQDAAGLVRSMRDGDRY